MIKMIKQNLNIWDIGWVFSYYILEIEDWLGTHCQARIQKFDSAVLCLVARIVLLYP